MWRDLPCGKLGCLAALLKRSSLFYSEDLAFEEIVSVFTNRCLKPLIQVMGLDSRGSCLWFCECVYIFIARGKRHSFDC
jgi:hypothetical protein